jgi:phosphoglycolate phosphatase-like HAD superfamily hydrolase
MKAYLFDLDGTLAASEAPKARALAQACVSYGAEANYPIYADVMGEDWPTVTRHFFKRYTFSPEFDEFNDRFSWLLSRSYGGRDLGKFSIRSFQTSVRNVGVDSSVRFCHENSRKGYRDRPRATVPIFGTDFSATIRAGLVAGLGIPTGTGRRLKRAI